MRGHGLRRSACEASSEDKVRKFCLLPFCLLTLTSAVMSGEYGWLWPAAAAVAVFVGVIGWFVWRKGRPFAAGDVFRASRLSAGNHLFPTQVLISPSSVVQYTPHWIGRQEESIHMAHIASIKIETKLDRKSVV